MGYSVIVFKTPENVEGYDPGVHLIDVDTGQAYSNDAAADLPLDLVAAAHYRMGNIATIAWVRSVLKREHAPVLMNVLSGRSGFVLPKTDVAVLRCELVAMLHKHGDDFERFVHGMLAVVSASETEGNPICVI